MNAIIRLLSCAALAAPLAVCAAEPMTGRVLLIDYDRVIEGQIERDGAKYRVRQNGGEMSLPATPTMVLLNDRESAFQLVKSRANLNDVRERVRLARWCIANQLKPHAVQEAEAALALEPDSRALKRFVEEVKAQASLSTPSSVAETKPAPKLAAPESTNVDVNPEAFSLFVTKVQPILMNACAQCHTGERGGSFKLLRTTYGDKHATQTNLAAVSAFLNRDQPSASAILARAVSVHGDSARPPLRDRQSPAFRYLEEWARLATGRPLTPAPPATIPADAIADAQPLPAIPVGKSAPDTPPVTVSPMRDEKLVPAKGREPTKAPEAPKSEASDPFDPVQFNKQGEKKP